MVDLSPRPPPRNGEGELEVDAASPLPASGRGARGERLTLSRARLDVPTRFLTREMLATMEVFPADVREVTVTPSTLDHPTILTYYRRSDRQWE